MVNNKRQLIIRNSTFAKVLLVVWVAVSSAIIRADEKSLNIAVASNFAETMKTVAAQYESDTGHKINVISGSSGKLFAQIIHGAPFDLFFSADAIKTERLVALGFAAADTHFTYAIGSLVLYSAASTRSVSIEAMLKEESSTISLANPKLAPYGRAAKEFMISQGIWDNLNFRKVIGENINQAFQFVASQNSDWGLVALSQVKNEKAILESQYWPISTHQYSPIKQNVVMLINDNNNALKREFLAYIQSEKIRTLIVQRGYRLEP